MLILRRKVGDSFVIGEDINITVISTDSSGNVNLGIEAPKDVLILRSELKQAANVNVDAALSQTKTETMKQFESIFKKANPKEK